MENEKLKSGRQRNRKLVQLYAALLYNANLKGFIDGHIYSGPLKSVCAPGFNCYSCPGAVAGCPLGSLQNALNAAGHTAPWYMLGMIALFGVILGRTICGWICPLGLIQELIHKLPVPKIRKSAVTRLLTYLKYVFLAAFVIAIPIWYGVNKGIPYPAFCKFICPAGTFEGAVGLLQNKANATSFYQLKMLFTNKWVIMLAVALACAFCYRTFCRFICPLGAIYGFFNRFSVVGVKVDHDRCIGCGLCVRKCQMDVTHVGDHECISCGKCMDGCPEGAISLKAGSATLAGPVSGKNADPEEVISRRRTIGRVIWAAALALLAFALIYFNRPRKADAGGQTPPPMAADAAAESVSSGSAAEEMSTVKEESAAEAATDAGPAASDAAAVSMSSVSAAEEMSTAKEMSAGESSAAAVSGETGSAVGDILPDFGTELLGGGEFRLADHRGQVVIINLWATTCAPCIAEMPYYEQLKTEQPDVEILAIHHRAGAKKAEDFLADKGWDHLDFALDSKEKGLFALLEASDAMPQTIVINRDGVITYNAQAPLSYEQLEKLVEQAS